MCYKGLNRTRATFRRHYYERHPSANLSELNNEEVAGVLLNVLSRLTGKCFFCIKIRLDGYEEKQRNYVGLKRRGESVWIECMYRIPLCWVRFASSTWSISWFWIQILKDFNYFKSKSRKRLGSLSMVSLNSNDSEEYWNSKVIPQNDLKSKRMKLEQNND